MSEALVAPSQEVKEVDPVLIIRGVTKRFEGVTALREVDFELRTGEVHVLFGENGAGKSTLINIIAGTFSPDEGTYLFEARDVRRLTPHQARAAGISAGFQEFSLAPNLTVVENVFLGREVKRNRILDRAAMRKRACRLVEELRFDLDLDRLVGALSRAHQQMVEIAKALLSDPRILILDEPTASLTEWESGRLFEIIAMLKARGGRNCLCLAQNAGNPGPSRSHHGATGWATCAYTRRDGSAGLRSRRTDDGSQDWRALPEVRSQAEADRHRDPGRID